MIESYNIVKFIHVTAIILSVCGFTIRFVLQSLNSPYQSTIVFKKLPHLVDTILLATALIMIYILDLNPFTTPWLAEKLLGLVIYILLGMVALKWAKNRWIKTLAAVMAIITFAYIIYVAHYKAPAVIFSY